MIEPSDRILILFVLAIVGIAHVVNSYNSLIETRPAFLYVEDSDDLYYIEMAASMDEDTLLAAITPFKSPEYREPYSIEYAGKLSDILAAEKLERKKTTEEIMEEIDARLNAEPDINYESKRLFERARCCILRNWDQAKFKADSDTLREVFSLTEFTPSSEVSKVEFAILRREYEHTEAGIVATSDSLIKTSGNAILFEGYSIYPFLQLGLDSFLPYPIYEPEFIDMYEPRYR